MAIKEEQYDPGYEDAYGGSYAEKGPEAGQAQSQVNGHCTFASAENTGKNTKQLQWADAPEQMSLPPVATCIITTGLKGDTAVSLSFQKHI